jgi:hypothetical protein
VRGENAFGSGSFSFGTFLLDKQKKSGIIYTNVLFLLLPQKEIEPKRKVTAV